MVLFAEFEGIGVAPTVISAEAQSSTQVRVTFSEAMSPTGITTVANYTITEDVGSTARGIVSVSIVSPTQVDVFLDGATTAGTDNYNVEVDTAITDLAGNPLEAPLDADFDGIAAPVHTTPFIADHCAAAIDRLAVQFYGKADLESLICIFADQVQELEQAFADVLAFRSLDTATGNTLDLIGVLYGVMREGVLDDEYRSLLKAAAMIVASHGRPDELLEILTTLDNGYNPGVISLAESFPAALVFQSLVAEGDVPKGTKHARMLYRAKSAAVRMIVEFYEEGVDIFEWFESGTGLGWAEEGAPTVGGTWAEGVGGEQ